MAFLATFSDVAPSWAHIFIFEDWREGACAQHDGAGWFAEVFLNIPDASALNLLTAESYVASRQPDFTFHTPWIDFPAGPDPYHLDADIHTLADFLDDYVTDLSDPAMLDQPFSHLLIRFNGYLRVTAFDDVFAQMPPEANGGFGPLIWVELGTYGYDGYRLRLHTTVYRLPVVDPANGFFHENVVFESLGMYPIQVTYFSRYDPTGVLGTPRAGIEFYSWHGGGFAWPAGSILVHPVTGPSTTVPPRVIFSAQDLRPIVPGDFDADYDIDLQDVSWFQVCYTGESEEGGFTLGPGCDAFDFDGDADIDRFDYAAMQAGFNGPGLAPNGDTP